MKILRAIVRRAVVLALGPAVLELSRPAWATSQDAPRATPTKKEGEVTPGATSERPLIAEELTDVRGYSASGMRVTGCDPAGDPSTIVEAIDNFVDAWPRRDPEKVKADLARHDDMIDLAWSLGAAWGDQLVRKFDYSWEAVTENGKERYGVVSRNRAVSVYPSYFVRECFYDASRDFTALLIFNMIVAGDFNDWPAGGYKNLAEDVVRIVPRR